MSKQIEASFSFSFGKTRRDGTGRKVYWLLPSLVLHYIYICKGECFCRLLLLQCPCCAIELYVRRPGGLCQNNSRADPSIKSDAIYYKMGWDLCGIYNLPPPPPHIFIRSHVKWKCDPEGLSLRNGMSQRGSFLLLLLYRKKTNRHCSSMLYIY